MLFTITTGGATRLIDAPKALYEAAARGLATPDTVIVEPQIDDRDELEAIVSDYLAQAAHRNRVPMTFSTLGDFLEALAA